MLEVVLSRNREGEELCSSEPGSSKAVQSGTREDLKLCSLEPGSEVAWSKPEVVGGYIV